MEFNGFQRNDETSAADEAPTKQPRSGGEMPAGSAGEAAAAAARPERGSSAAARQGLDSAKRTRPRRCRGTRVFPGERSAARSPRLQARHNAPLPSKGEKVRRMIIAVVQIKRTSQPVRMHREGPP